MRHHPAPVRTSQTHPLRIAEIATPDGSRLGVTFAPGKVQQNAMTGAWARDLDTDLDAVAAWGAAAVVTLVEDHELESLQIRALGEGVQRRHMEWHHRPIVDVSTPCPRFEAGWAEDSRRLRGMLASGSNVLVHCKGGLGRAGMVAARLLVEMGIAPATAVAQVRAVRPGALETPAQERWVAAERPAPPPHPATDADAVRDRAMGALVGLAVGDAVGTTLEFQPKPARPVLDDMVGGGPFGLAPGQWTDDTAMALALADSLLAYPEFDATDLMHRFVNWHEWGTYSCTGSCFDIGNAVRSALSRYQRGGDPMAGSTDPDTAGNGALMRLSPVAVRYWAEPERLAEVAALQTRTTHGAPECVDASRLFADMLAEAIRGEPVPAVLRPREGRNTGKVAAIASGASWRGQRRDAMRGSGYVVHALEASLWAVSRTTSFRSAVLLAANLGEDADTTAAITGQLAGALYGLTGIPAEWLDRLAWRERIEVTAARLYEAGGTALG